MLAATTSLRNPWDKRALVLSEQASDTTNIGSSLNNIGNIYQKQGKLKLALDYYEQALIHHKQADYLAGIAVSFHNIGDIYFQQGLLSRAIKQYLRALKSYERLGRGFESDVIDELEVLAFCYAQLGDIEKAVAYNIRIKQVRELIKPTS